METRFIAGGEFVDKATYIETRDKLSRSIEHIAELEAEVARLRRFLNRAGWDDEVIDDPAIAAAEKAEADG